MEVIRKTITLETAKTRQDYKMPSFKDGKIIGPDGQYAERYNIDTEGYDKDYNAWGNFPLDYILEPEEIVGIAVEPLKKCMKINGVWEPDDENKYVARYSTLANTYDNYIKIISTATFYRVCKRGDNKVAIKFTEKGKTKIEMFFGDIDKTYDIFDTIPELTELDYGYEFGVLQEYEKLKIIFGEEPREKLYALLFNIIEPYLSLRQTDTNRLSAPYLNVPLYIEQTYDDEGIYDTNAVFWEPNKKYYLGDKVIYNLNSKYGEVYVLYKGVDYETLEITGEMYDKFKDTAKNYPPAKTDEDLKHRHLYKDGDGHLFMYTPYFKGYFDDNTHKTYFDNIDKDKNVSLVHWKLCIDGAEGEDVSGTSESMLISCQRQTRSYDDNNIELPFNFIITEGTLQYDTTMRYKIGTTNVEYRNGVLKGDCVEKVIFYEKQIGSGITTWKEYKIFEEEGCISTDKLKKDGEYIDLGRIRIEYLINCELDDDGKVIEGTGVKYVDTFDMEMSIYRTTVDGVENKEFIYVDIDYNTVKHKAEVSFTAEMAKKDTMYDVEIFKKESNLGIQNIRYDLDGKIERGKYAAFERHNILGEINTFEDLKNYRNNYFKL